ncbi:MAG: NAD(P)-binding domain-containing protein [Gammaproteobacteria bacterium]|nr:NAD(P)-binding domain-containing protein [Gammaproteobacteria bacterium]
MKDVSIIGLGVMGTELARVLIENGYRVTVWNRTPEKAAPHVEAGATLAPSAADAVASSATTIVCIRTHSDTRALLQKDPGALAGKTIIELSTGEAGEAEELSRWIGAQGADCLIGMIATFPSGIGKSDSAIVTVGSESAWQGSEDVLKALAGSSSYIGSDVGALAALFAGLFLPRQGFMFGMIYGALVCEKAGISMDDYVRQIPLTLKVVHDYYDVFAATVPSGDFANPPASIGTYLAAFQDTLNTFRKLGVTHELPELLHGLVKRGVDAGLAEEQITALTKVLRR